MVGHDTPDRGEYRSSEASDGLTLTRRTALGLLGIGTVGAAMAGTTTADHGDGGDDVRPWNQHVDAKGHDLRDLHALDVEHVYTAARDADVIVWRDENDVFHADSRDGTVESGEDVMVVTQAAVDSLTEGRTTKEKVVVVSSGTVPNDTGDRKTIELSSYTVLDVPATIHVEHDPGEHSNDVVVRAVDEEHVEIPRLSVTGGPWMAIRLRSCSNVRLGHIDVRYAADSNANDAIRIDDGGDDGRCEDVQLNSAYIENSTQHAVETAGVDRFQAGQVIGKNLGGCAVLLNDTTDATVNSIIGKEPRDGYATLRLANGNENISIGNVVARGGHRGIAIITDARNVTVGQVNISHTDWDGIQIVDAENVMINGGIVRNCGRAGVTIYSHLNDPENEGITLSNLRIVDDRDPGDRQQTWAINEEGNSQYNRFVDNDVRNGGVEGLIRVGSETTVVRDNVGAGLDSGVVTLESGQSPAARVENVTTARGSTLSVRASALSDPGTFAWDSYFLWDGENGKWDLVFEWKADPGEDLDLEYIVDRNQTNLVEVFEQQAEEWLPGQVDQEEGPGMVDDFSSGNMDTYVGATGDYDVTSDSPIAVGEYSLKSTSGSDAIVGSFDGLPRYPEAGDTFAAKVAQTGTTHVLGLAFGMQNLQSFYFTRFWDDDRLQLYKVEDGAYTELTDGGSGVSIDSETIYDLVVDWGTDGEITIDMLDPDGETVTSLSTTDDTFTDGGIGTRRTAMLDEIRIL